MKKNIIVLATAIFYSQFAFATPSLYPTDIGAISRVQNNTTSNIIGDDKDPRTIYVMPPIEASGVATGAHTPTLNLLYCPRMQQLVAEGDILQDQTYKLTLQLADVAQNFKAVEDQILAAKLEAAKYAADNHLVDFANMNFQIEDLRRALINLADKANSCRADCQVLVQQLQDTSKLLTELSAARAKFIQENYQTASVYVQKLAAADALESQKNKIQTDYIDLNTRLHTIQTSLDDLFRNYGQLEGARASFTYSSNWQNNVVQLRNENPGYNFAQLPTQEAVVYPGVVGVQGLPGTTSVLAFEAPGVSQIKDGGIPFSSYPAAFTGNVVLSLIGTCPMFHPEYFKFAPGVSDPKNMKFGLTISYKYPSSMMLQMKVHYNMYKLYQIIKQSGSSGGLFSSHSWSTSEERNFFHDGFYVDWKIQDPNNTITDEERIQKERDARTAVMTRFIGLALPSSPDKSLFTPAGAAPTHGAIVVADSLNSACPTNAYCIGASIILRGLDAIFGSSSSSTNYTEIKDIWLEEEWSLNQTVLKPWVTTYSMK